MSGLKLCVGVVRRLEDEGQSSAIDKQVTDGPLLIGAEGLAGDAQADRRVHGGPEKAIHHYPAENYARLAERFPAIAVQLHPGSIGENIAIAGWNENNVCIGDVFRLGDARIQVSQPRTPCWKIDHRYASKGIAAFIAESGLTGWYYRVLEGGQAASGGPFELLVRQAGAVSLAELWRAWREHRPDPAVLARLSEAPGLTPGWRKKLHDRLDWLRANAATSTPPPPAFHVKPNDS